MVARDQDAAVLVLSSIPRSAELPGASGRPMVAYPEEDEPAALRMGLGKESGEIEFSADTVLSLSTSLWVATAEPGHRSQVAIAVAKNRYGETGWAFGRFTGTEWKDSDPVWVPKRAKGKNGKSPDAGDDGKKVTL